MIFQPCFKCKDRKVTRDYNCHTDCVKYLQYAEQNEIARAGRMAQAKANEIDDVHGYPRKRKR